MNAFSDRRLEDLAKLKALEQATNGRIRVTGHSGSPISRISLKFMVRTTADDSYPVNSISEVDAVIQLGSRYPFEEPAVSITTKIFNPNIYSSGRVCLGSKWIATEYLDLLAQRLFKILSYDEGIINTSSAANGEAARWYIKAKASNPTSFPTDTLKSKTTDDKPKISWTEKTEKNDRTIVSCPSCNSQMRVPAGKKIEVTCPKCKKIFLAKT